MGMLKTHCGCCVAPGGYGLAAERTCSCALRWWRSDTCAAPLEQMTARSCMNGSRTMTWLVGVTRGCPISGPMHISHMIEEA